MERVILHVDANHFYANVEKANNPALKGIDTVSCRTPFKCNNSGAAKRTRSISASKDPDNTNLMFLLQQNWNLYNSFEKTKIRGDSP